MSLSRSLRGWSGGDLEPKVKVVPFDARPLPTEKAMCWEPGPQCPATNKCWLLAKEEGNGSNYLYKDG